MGEKPISEEMLEEGLRKMMDRCEVHLAFYLASLKNIKSMTYQERKELKTFLYILINQLIILDTAEEDAEEEKLAKKRKR